LGIFAGNALKNGLGSIIDESSGELLRISKYQRIRQDLPLGVQFGKAGYEATAEEENSRHSGECTQRHLED
jgi:hypothetical protein